MKYILNWSNPVKIFAIIFIIIAAIFVAYRDALDNGFLTMWDTHMYVLYNPHIKALTWENIQWMFTSFYMVNWHPLTWLSHAIDYAWFGLEPWGHHLVNIIIHALNSILLFTLVIMLLSYQGVAKSLAPITDKTLLTAGIVAILFGIHPQHVESVVWIAERKDVLCLFFMLLTFIAYIFYNTAKQTTKLRWYIVTLLCFILALLAKPMAVTLPVILLLMDVYPLHRTRLTVAPNSVSYSRLILEKIPFFVLTLISAILTILAQHSDGAIANLEGVSIQIRFLNVFNSLIFYISKLIFPIGLSPLYPLPSYRHLSDFSSYLPSLIPIMACVFITFICGYLWHKKQYYWLIAWLFYLVTLSPVIGIIQVGSQAAADRYAYLPTIPFYIFISFGIVKLLYDQHVKQYFKLVIVTSLLLVSILFIHLTQQQSHIWKNDLTFWGYIAAFAPNNILAHGNLGDVYMKMGEYEKAVGRYQHTLYLNPPHAMKNGTGGRLAEGYVKLGQLQEGLEILNYLIDNNITKQYKVHKLYSLRGEIYFKQGLLELAKQSLQKALKLSPTNQQAAKLLAEINAQ